MCPWDRTFLSLISFEVDHLSLLGTVPSFHQYRFEVGQLILPLDRTFLSVIILCVERSTVIFWFVKYQLLFLRSAIDYFIGPYHPFCSFVLGRSTDYFIGLYQPFSHILW